MGKVFGKQHDETNGRGRLLCEYFLALGQKFWKLDSRRDSKFLFANHYEAKWYYPSNTNWISAHPIFSFFLSRILAKRRVSFPKKWYPCSYGWIESHSFYKGYPPQRFLPVAEKILSAYKLWQEMLKLFPKTTRYSLGIKTDVLFIEIFESISTATFTAKTEKSPWVRRAIIKLDTLKGLLRVAWEIKSLDNKKYITLSEQLSEIGRQLGGWHNQIVKQNSPSRNVGEKWGHWRVDRRRVVVVPIVVKPVVIPAPLAIIPVQIQHITVAVRITKNRIKCLLFHHP